MLKNQTWNEIAQKLYAQAGPQGQPGAAGQPGPDMGAGAAGGPTNGAAKGGDDGKVEDAEYEVVDDDKKN